MNRFVSFRDGAGCFVQALSGASIVMTLLKVDPRLREKILLSVSMANNCGN